MGLQIGYYTLAILGIIKKRSKWLTALMLLMMWIVFGLCTYNGDFINYEHIYLNIQNPNYWMVFEPLYTLLMYICSSFGLDFIQFRMVFGAIYVILLYYTTNRYTENCTEAIGFFMLFPFLVFTSIIRSGLAGIIVVLAYHEIIAGKDNKFKFWALIITATMIQFTSIYFAFYYFVRKIQINKKNIMIIVGLVVSASALYFSGVLYQLASIIIPGKSSWFLPGVTGQEPRWILYLVIIELLVIFLSYMSRKNSHEAEERGLEMCINPYSEDILRINISMLIFIPTFFATNASSRFIWQLLLLNIICFSKDDECGSVMCSLSKIHFSRGLIIMLSFLMFFSFYADLPYRGTQNEGSLIFQNNVIYRSFNPSQQQQKDEIKNE